MTRLLYQIHRWVGIALALFMVTWFLSGLVIMYAPSSALGRTDQLARAESLRPESGWLSLGEAWQRSAAQRATPDEGKKPGLPAEARLVRQGGEGRWLVDDSKGKRHALSASDGRLVDTSVEQATRIVRAWIATDAADAAVRYIDTGIQDSAVRNHEALRPFHRFAVGEGSREVLVSARSGEVVRDSTRLDRALYWTGNWIHLLRPLETAGLSADTRRTVLTWLGFFAFASALTGLIIGWQRWRPGWGGRPTYSQGRTQPYREFWVKWHFWAGLLGGTFALLWAFSGYLNGNPFKLFSPATASREEAARYQGSDLPAAMRDWRPSAFVTDSENKAIVELVWRRLGDQTVLLGLTRDGERQPQPVDSAERHIDEAALLTAARRLAGSLPLAGHTLLTEYDSYYYARHGQGLVDRPLPVLQVDIADEGATRLYLDPQDGRLLLRQDTSRRVYRWVWSAIHHWDFAWLRHRPLWDAWMLTWVLMGVALGVSSVVIGWKRLKKTVKPSSKARPRPATPSSNAPRPLAADGQTS